MNHIDFFNKVQKQLDTKLPFVIFRNPNEDKIQGFLQSTNDLHTNRTFKATGFVFSPFEEGVEQTVWMYEHECESINTEFVEQNIYVSPASYSETNDKKQKHISLVNKAIKKLQLGELQKVVISRSELQIIKDSDPIEWFKHILDQYTNTFCYCWYHPKVGMWLGATPETLISLSKNEFKTMALAGTMPYKGSKVVAWGIKEKEEQQLVVDSILKGLKQITKQVEKGITSTQKAGSLLHLKTDISGVLNNSKDLKVLIEVLHPTSAVCGIPKEKSKEFILKNENYNRSYYTGYLGMFSPEGQTHLFVNLRCMQVHEKSIEVYVGGGITALSNANAEWEETVNKSRIMKSIV